ncbi:MAG: PD-(D/E)XK nuclease family protein [Treponema sp.]|nr:PD-(D/E)XK nuclease family protein [Treponema sp.]
MCRILADLLDTKGLHGRGNLYLKHFIDMVVKQLIDKDGQFNFNLSKAKVVVPCPTSKGRFIDIAIDDGTVFIPIEAKIYTGDSERQLADYAEFSREMNSGGFVPVLFLTRGGYKSSKALDSEYVPVAFDKHIVP